MELTIADLADKLLETERERDLLYRAVKEAIENNHTTFALREHRLAVYDAMKQNGWEQPSWLQLSLNRP